MDLKSTEDASLEGFTRSVAKYNYAMQAAFYSDGIEAATLKPVHGFAFVACEKVAPYAVQCFQLDFQAMEAGRVTYMNLLTSLADCKYDGKFPAYSDAIETLSLPNWALRGVWE